MLAKIRAALAERGQAGARLAMARPTEDERVELARRLEASPDPLSEMIQWARARGARRLASAVEALQLESDDCDSEG